MSEASPPKLRLGLQGWPHPEWIDHYFPVDLPQDWRFSYYANEASCLLLDQASLAALDAEEVANWLEEAPGHFRLYLQNVAPGLPVSALGTRINKTQNHWLTADSHQTVAVLPYTDNLRALRSTLEQLPEDLEAIVFTGDANPQQLHEIRTLAELLGIA